MHCTKSDRFPDRSAHAEYAATAVRLAHGFARYPAGLLFTLFIAFAIALPADTFGQTPNTEEKSSIESDKVREFSDLTSDEYQQVYNRMVPRAFRPIKLNVRVEDGQPRFDVTLKHITSASPWLARHGLSNRRYADFCDEQKSLGYEETLHARYRIRGRTYHASVFEKKIARGDALKLPEGKLPETGATLTAFQPLDNLMRNFLKDNQVPGATLAVSRHGRIYYERGFGYSSLEEKIPMPFASKMRIASISKPITAVAILQLVENGKLTLDETFLPHIQKLLGFSESEIQDERIKKITIRQLLQHTGGWDREASFDPMFRSISIANAMRTSSPASARTIIRYMLTTQKLDHAPGQKVAYSNFGYSLLGRVIEAVSGTTYSSYVQTNLFNRIGMSNSQPGRTLQRFKAENEATYHMRYGETGPAIFASVQRRQEVLRPYGVWALEPMDSHGGWISTAGDLVRFGNAFRNWNLAPETPISNVTDDVKKPSIDKKLQLLTRESRQAAFSPPECEDDGRRRFYGLGWSVRRSFLGTTCWHSGLLDGTSTLLVCRNDGFVWAVMFNINRVENGERCASEIDPRLHRAVNSVRDWSTTTISER